MLRPSAALLRSRVRSSYLFVWAGDDAKQSSDFLAVIDADSKSPQYAQAVASVAVPGPSGTPHHTELEMPESGFLLANAFERFGWRFQIRDKVIQTENDYDKDVFNGDVGIVERVDPLEQQVAVRFDERLVKYDFGNWTRFRWLTRSRSTSRRDRSSRQS